ncbi:hypothetical protein K450DRAFT_196621 [Umbelopsis ramanniana AG]|uniref:Uncharacterized protein n=1 Tax=Umbelopsis ramanniana AG TaxID=1314678 RepID=A0AAD5EGR9_UMBRA|nr:uncharacterized protein K450DRAFT_196621 [Umbelopsis ramanniana AG]KAI8582611.1 hypothetical protein K450DRAFT_196621 [Umbelopsis ramanniana AG]
MHVSVDDQKNFSKVIMVAFEAQEGEIRNAPTTPLMRVEDSIDHFREELQKKHSSVSNPIFSNILHNGLLTISFVSAMENPFGIALLILATLPGVLAECRMGIDEISQAAAAIINQIPGQTLLLSIGAAFGGNQDFANDSALSIGLLPIGVAGINGIHAASKIFSGDQEVLCNVTDNELENRPPGMREYAGLIARVLRLSSTAIVFMVIGMMTCRIVFLGWLGILLLTFAVVAIGECYAPLDIIVVGIADGAVYYRGREDGSYSDVWRYTLTPAGNIIIHNNSLQSEILNGRNEIAIDTDWYRFYLKRWAGTYLAAALSFGSWVWWLFSLQLLAPWSWAPTASIVTSVFALLLAEWCDSIDSKDISYGFSRKALSARRKIAELNGMFGAASVSNHMSREEKLWLTNLMVESLVTSGYLSSSRIKYRIPRRLGSNVYIGTKLSDVYDAAAKVTNVLQHEKDRLEVAGNSWPHLRVVEWAIGWTMELSNHAMNCSLYMSELKNYYQSGLHPNSTVLKACAAMSHDSCDTIRRFRKEAETVWKNQLWKLVALAQICTDTHPQLAARAAFCDPGNHGEALKLWSEYLFGHQDWDPCIVILNMFCKLYLNDAIGYSAYYTAMSPPEQLTGCQYNITFEKVIIWFGSKVVELNRSIPGPLAAPPRFASNSMFIPITEAALRAETKILSYLREHDPHMLNIHAAHALLEVPNYGTEFRRDYADHRYLETNQCGLPSPVDEEKMA